MLQGFPKYFKLPELPDSTLYHQAGNSVPVPVVERVFQQILKVLNSEKITEFKSNELLVKKRNDYAMQTQLIKV